MEDASLVQPAVPAEPHEGERTEETDRGRQAYDSPPERPRAPRCGNLPAHTPIEFSAWESGRSALGPTDGGPEDDEGACRTLGLDRADPGPPPPLF